MSTYFIHLSNSDLLSRFHEHIVEDDVPECTTIKEFKCEQKTRGYTTEEVSELANSYCWRFLEYEETAGGVRFTQSATICIS